MRPFRSFFSKTNFKNFQILFCFQSGNSDFQSYRAWKAHFGCLESVFKAFHEYVLSIFRKLCASWALDIAPTLDVPVLLFLFVSSDHRPHRVCTTFYRLHSCSHVLVSTRFTVNPAVTGSSPFFSQKLFQPISFGTVRLFQFFSALWDFFSKFSFCRQWSPFKFFDILQQTEVSKSPKGPPF